MNSSDALMDESLTRTDSDWPDHSPAKEEEPEGEFEGECWLSTDGKHTVRIKATTDGGRRRGLIWAKMAYEAIIEKYGTKQALNAKTYAQPNGTEVKCWVHGTPMKLIPKGISKTTGKPYPEFLACQTPNADGSRCGYKQAK